MRLEACSVCCAYIEVWYGEVCCCHVLHNSFFMLGPLMYDNFGTWFAVGNSR